MKNSGNYVTNEVAIDYNAGLTGLLAAAVMDSGRLEIYTFQHLARNFNDLISKPKKATK